MYREHPFGYEARITPFSFLFNVLWLVVGGGLAAIGWFIAAFVMALTIIGLPWARAAFDNGVYTLWPFGVRSIGSGYMFPGALGTGFFGLIGNIVWFVLAGWWLALGHVVMGIGYAITIIGLPFAWAHFKLAGFALWPIGRTLTRSDYSRRAYYA